jgi:hypothetical protein
MVSIKEFGRRSSWLVFRYPTITNWPEKRLGKPIKGLVRLLYLTVITVTILLLTGAIAQGVPHTATITDLLCFPIWVLIISDSSTRDLWQLTAETSSSTAEETWREMAAEFCLRSISFYMFVLLVLCLFYFSVFLISILSVLLLLCCMFCFIVFCVLAHWTLPPGGNPAAVNKSNLI